MASQLPLLSLKTSLSHLVFSPSTLHFFLLYLSYQSSGSFQISNFISPWGKRNNIKQTKKPFPQPCIPSQLSLHLTIAKIFESRLCPCYFHFLCILTHSNLILDAIIMSLKFLNDQHNVKSNGFSVFSVQIHRLYLTSLRTYFFLKLANLSAYQILFSPGSLLFISKSFALFSKSFLKY